MECNKITQSCGILSPGTLMGGQSTGHLAITHHRWRSHLYRMPPLGHGALCRSMAPSIMFTSSTVQSPTDIFWLSTIILWFCIYSAMCTLCAIENVLTNAADSTQDVCCRIGVLARPEQFVCAPLKGLPRVNTLVTLG